MKRKRMHGKKRSPFCKTGDPSLENYAKYPQSQKIRVYDTDLYKRNMGTITKSPSNFEKFKSFRQRNMNLIQDLTAPGVSKIKGLIQATKDKLKKK